LDGCMGVVIQVPRVVVVSCVHSASRACKPSHGVHSRAKGKPILKNPQDVLTTVFRRQVCLPWRSKRKRDGAMTKIGRSTSGMCPTRIAQA
jgi:hypothetical protein